MISIRAAGVLAMTVLAAFHANAEKINVAVASNFTAPMKDIVEEFETATGHEVGLAFGSSGKFYAQIVNGAPFLAFFSADQAKPAALDENGLTVPGSRFTYATGSLALWSADPELVDGDASVLRQGRFDKLAIANPKLAPYGVAAVETLESLGLRDATRREWVQGENIAQTYQFVQTGNAEVGFVALSQIMTRGRIGEGSAWPVPSSMHAPIRQDAVLLRRGAGSDAARELLRFVRSDAAAKIIESYGYATPRQGG